MRRKLRDELGDDFAQGDAYERQFEIGGRMERRRVTDDLEVAIDQFLTAQSCGAVAAFVYGSVATGEAGPTSDMDTFVLLAQPLPAVALQQLRSGFVDLQERLGYCPDVTFPIELFTVQQSRSALAGREVEQAIQLACSSGTLSTDLLDSDGVEVLRALLGTRLTVRASAQLDELTAYANQTLAHHLNSGSTSPEHEVLRALGIRGSNQPNAGGKNVGN
jgi:predicted nucleotidyltransferase